MVIKRWQARLALLFVLAAVAAPTLAEVSVRLDREQAVVGETVTLVLESTDTGVELDPDLSLLEDDFLVLGQRTESQVAITNGRRSAVVRRLVTLEPRRAGELQIPALDVGGVATSPLTLTVTAAPERPPGEPEPVFIEVELVPAAGPYYVHAQLALTVRIFYQQSLTEAAIERPSPEQATVRELDELPYQAERNGVRYRVLERRYAVFPERSGELEIPPMVLTGRLVDQPGQQLWQPSARGRRIERASEAIRVTVEPRPASFTGDRWLPARALQLSDQVTDVGDLRVGEPVTRTVIIDAVGLEENMLVAPDWPEMPGARIYPDQPQGITRDDGQWVQGHREYRYAVVPEAPGELVLPELELPWWDTESDEMRLATLPERRLRVQPALLPDGATPPSQPAVPAPASEAVSEDVIRQTRLESPWRWVALAFGLLWLGTLVIALRRQSPPTAPPPSRRDGDEAERLATLRKACQANDPRSARQALGAWMRHHGPGPNHDSLVRRAEVSGNTELVAAIHELEAAGFAPGRTSDWNGDALWQAVAQWRRERDRPEGHDRLDADLYAAAKAAR